MHVLKGIDLTIGEGEIVSIVGPSGAGKSTLLHIMGGLDKPDVGQVMFEGVDINKLKDKKRSHIRNQKFGFIFQFYHLLPEFSALENVILPSLVKGTETMEALKLRGRNLLDQVGLKERAVHKPNQLSGGEQQRVAIARALMNDPKVIFCDEPTGNLDSQSGNVVIQLLIRLNKKNKQTLILVTHDEEIAQCSQKIIHIRDGRLN